jgi:hypothetical protein
MRGIRSARLVGPGRALVTAGLLLPLVSAPALAKGADQAGQTAPSAQELIDRLAQIQGEIGGAPAKGSEAGAAQAPAPGLSEEQMRSRLEEELGVEVLGLEVVDPNGPPAYAVRVMNPPGNYDAAFLVSTLLVDGETGEILAQSPGRPTAADPDVLPESFRPDLDASGREIRRRSH